MTFHTAHEATAWFNGPATRWHHAVDIAAVPNSSGDPQRGVVIGSSCRAVGIYENLATPLSIASKYDHLPDASKEDVLSDPSVGMRVLPPQFTC
jgi:hypothetical protein